MDLPCLLQPDWLVRDGVLSEGASLAVGADGRVTAPDRLPPGTPTVRLPGRALLPGLVNAHSHAFQRLIRGRTEYVASGAGKDDFWSWREQMYRAASSLDPDGVYLASRQAFLEMALCGVTTVGEFHYLHHAPDGRPYDDPDELAHQVIRAAREVGLRIALLRVGYARSGYQVSPNPRQRRFIDPTPDRLLAAVARLESRHRDDPHVAVGLAPHSVRAVDRAWLEAIAGESGRRRVHMHVSEQPGEIEACLAEHGRRPVELLEELGLLAPRFTAVHAIHLTDAEIHALGAARAFVCACPTTERNLGDGIVPADRLLDAGARLCLGSDSQATIDLLEEARALEADLRLLRLRRAVLDPGGGASSGLAGRLLGIATAAGAESLGLGGGALREGEAADFLTLELTHPALAGATGLSNLVFDAPASAVRDVAVGGRWIVRDGQHPLTEASGRAFAALARRIFA